jgi:hypothetical protein
MVFFLFALAYSVTIYAESNKDVLLDKRNNPKFEDFPSDAFMGKILIPKEFKVDFDGNWRDPAGKIIEKPHINFAGKYFLSLHSCGTECRYYLLNDMSSGRSARLDMFSSTYPPNMTRDGFLYVTVLVFVKNSNMIVAQYNIDKGEETECRERIFVFDEKERIKPITKTMHSCTATVNESRLKGISKAEKEG